MSKTASQEIVDAHRALYREKSSKEKMLLLDNLQGLTGYTRKHLIALLNHEKAARKAGSGRKPILDDNLLKALIDAWQLAGRIASKRLAPFLPELIHELEKAGRIQLSKEEKEVLTVISAATIDRALKAERRKHARSRTTTKRASLIRSQIPIRTFTEWNDVEPGFFELDTVCHCASSTAGKYLATLNMTDIATGWTVPIALLRKGGVEVVAAIEEAREAIPFKILGIDCDNGTEFMNEHVLDWTKNNEVTFTRSREYKKNDQAWIEEKNGSVVRKYAGRDRYEGDKAWAILRELYSNVRLYVNFFMPSQKLLFKHRKGAKTYKKHDLAKTPYQRALENEHVSKNVKQRLKAQRKQLSMVQIRDEIDRLQTELRKHSIDLPDPIIAARVAQSMAVFNFVERTESVSQPKYSVLQRLRDILRSTEQGVLIRAKDFENIAPRSTLDTYLMRLTKEGLLRRIACGTYEVAQLLAETA